MSFLQVIRPTRRRRQPGHDDFNMRAPGGLHYARFMVRALNILKLSMLADVLPPGILTPAMVPLIDRMAQYIALFHGPWYLQARLAAPSPRLDLQLYHDMCTYEVN